MKKLTKVLILALVAVMLFGTVYSSAAEPYDTYTYSIDGEPLKSPAAYSAIDEFDAIDMRISKIDPNKPALSPTVGDIVSDENANIYIADSGNDRIVILNQFYEAIATISSYKNEKGQTLTLKNPKGVFVTDPNKTADGSSYIYVCDTDNKQIVIFDRNYQYVRTIVKPESEILTAEAFVPSAIAVDIYGRIFVVSTAAYEGVIVLSSEGDFTGFIGSQKVSYSLIEIIWRRFQSQEVRETATLNLANPYNNITVDDDGFVYVTTAASKPEDMKNQFSAIKSKAAAYSPVKKLNSQGVEIMKRNGFFDPGGEVDVDVKTVSMINDVAIGNQGSWTILDQSRSRFFTYDQNGNLLFAFGGKGDQLGHGSSLVGMTYQIVEEDGKETYRLISLDAAGTGAKITIYDPTPYCDAIMTALYNENVHNYTASQKDWEKVLTLNNNFDLAYIGIGKALYNQGKYEEAMEYLESAYETDMWSKANSASSKDFMSDWLLVVVIGVIVVVVLFFKFLGYAKKKNKATSLKVGKKTYWEELLFAFHLVFHPFDGFWDLKHEKRGSVRGASTILAITVLAFFYQSIGRGYAFNPRGESNNLLVQIVLLGVPFILFAISNWCLTTLFDGEGSFKDIYIAAGYSLAPLPLFVILSTILTNVLAIESQGIVNLIVVIGYVWVGILLFFGVQVTHDYTMKKNFITVLGTIVAMLVIAFIVVLFFSLVAKMVTFVISIFTEIGNRM